MQRIINTTLGKTSKNPKDSRFVCWKISTLASPSRTPFHWPPHSVFAPPTSKEHHAKHLPMRVIHACPGGKPHSYSLLSWICPHYTHHTHMSGLPDLCLCMSDHFYCPSLRLIQWWVPMVEMPILWFKRCKQIGSWRQSVSSQNIVLQYIQCVYTSCHFPFRKEDNSANRHVPFKILHFCKKHFKIMQFVAQPPAHHLKDGFGFWGWRETIQLWLPRSIVQHDDNTPYRNIIRLEKGLEG